MVTDLADDFDCQLFVANAEHHTKLHNTIEAENVNPVTSKKAPAN